MHLACVCTVHSVCTYTGVVYSPGHCVWLLCEVNFFRTCVFGIADTCMFLRMVTAPHSNVTVLPVSCPVLVLHQRDTKERKRERDKAEHMQLCEQHFVHAIVDDSTDISDLGPTNDTENIELKVRRADNIEAQI